MVTRTQPRRHKESHLSAIAFLGVSLIVSAIIVSRNSTPRPNETQRPAIVAEFDTVPIPVPARAVPIGTKGKDIVIKFVSFPRQQIPAGAIHDPSSISGLVTIASLPADLPLFESNFSKNSSVSNPVVERIPPGMRAMTLRVDATAAVEGWAGSGAIVDVLLVTKDQTKVVAEKVKVLSAERSVAPVEGGGTPNVPSTITVLVSQEQCLAIHTAIPLGKIAFALRSSHDEQHWSDSVYTAERLRGTSVSDDKKTTRISGFVSVKGDEKKFAFTDGRWIKADSIPTGFFVNQD